MEQNGHGHRFDPGRGIILLFSGREHVPKAKSNGALDFGWDTLNDEEAKLDKRGIELNQGRDYIPYTKI